MIIAEELVEDRLNSSDNLALKMGKGNRVNHKDAGRKEGDVNLHPVVRSVIAAAARLDTAKNVAENFDVSPAQVHNLKHGKTTALGEVKEEIVKGTEKELEGVRAKAVEILVSSLGFIDESKLKDLKATSLTNVAKDMASVIEKTSPKVDLDRKPTVVIITAPKRELKDYTVIEVESTVVE